MSKDVRHALGRAGEDEAARHLERLGYDVIARNIRTRWGELDLVACNAATLVFAEVKTRRAGSWSPLESFTEPKREQVRRIAAMWLADARDRPFAPQLRFDAIAVTFDARGRLVRLDHLEGAF